MPEEREFFQMPPEWGVHFTVEAFLRALPDEQREPVTDRLFRDSPSLSQRLRVLNSFGAFPDREDRRPEREFLSEETTRTLVRELSCAVLESETAQIADEPFLVRLMAMTLDLDETSAREAIALRAEDDHFFLRLLQGCVRSGRSGGGDGVVRRIVRLTGMVW
jgi:hypothetical protein